MYFRVAFFWFSKSAVQVHRAIFGECRKLCVEREMCEWSYPWSSPPWVAASIIMPYSLTNLLPLLWMVFQCGLWQKASLCPEYEFFHKQEYCFSKSDNGNPDCIIECTFPDVSTYWFVITENFSEIRTPLAIDVTYLNSGFKPYRYTILSITSYRKSKVMV